MRTLYMVIQCLSQVPCPLAPLTQWQNYWLQGDQDFIHLFTYFTDDLWNKIGSECETYWTYRLGLTVCIPNDKDYLIFPKDPVKPRGAKSHHLFQMELGVSKISFPCGHYLLLAPIRSLWGERSNPNLRTWKFGNMWSSKYKNKPKILWKSFTQQMSFKYYARDVLLHRNIILTQYLYFLCRCPATLVTKT